MDLFNIIYPVGSIYLSMDDNFNPNIVFGGKWEKIQTGRYLQACENGSGELVDESVPNITGAVGQNGTNRRGLDGSFTGVFKQGVKCADYSGAYNPQSGYLNYREIIPIVQLILNLQEYLNHQHGLQVVMQYQVSEEDLKI